MRGGRLGWPGRPGLGRRYHGTNPHIFGFCSGARVNMAPSRQAGKGGNWRVQAWLERGTIARHPKYTGTPISTRPSPRKL